MSTLDTLRKQYEHLNTFERAVMLGEAFVRMDESAVDALEPPSLWDAFHTAGHESLFIAIAFSAVHESQKGESTYRLVWGLLTSAEWRGIARGELSPAEEEKLIQYEEWMKEAGRKRVAWLLALQALDDEVGSACFASAKIFAGEYVSHTLEGVKSAEVDHSAEYGYLRELWKVGSRNRPDAPKIQAKENLS